MGLAVVDEYMCDRNPGCPARRLCPNGAFLRTAEGERPGAWRVDESLCTGCGVCVRACPMGAVTLIG
jgi:Fe-S-cluster-containing hydrogenase component 2